MAKAAEKEVLQLKLDSLASLVKNLKSKQVTQPQNTQNVQVPERSKMLKSAINAKLGKQLIYSGCPRTYSSANLNCTQKKSCAGSSKWQRSFSTPELNKSMTYLKTTSQPSIVASTSLQHHSPHFHVNHGSCQQKKFTYKQTEIPKTGRSSQGAQSQYAQLWSPLKLDKRSPRNASLTFAKGKQSSTSVSHLERMSSMPGTNDYVFHKDKDALKQGRVLFSKQISQAQWENKTLASQPCKSSPVFKEVAVNAIKGNKTKSIPTAAFPGYSTDLKYELSPEPRTSGTTNYVATTSSSNIRAKSIMTWRRNKHNMLPSWNRKRGTLSSVFRAGESVSNVDLKPKRWSVKGLVSRHKLVNKHNLTWKGKEGTFTEKRAKLVSQGRYKVLLTTIPSMSFQKTKGKRFINPKQDMVKSQEGQSGAKTGDFYHLNRKSPCIRRRTAIAVTKGLNLKSRTVAEKLSTPQVQRKEARSAMSWKAERILVSIGGSTFQTGREGRSLKRLRSSDARDAAEPAKKKICVSSQLSHPANTRQTASHLLRRSIFRLTRYKAKKAGNSQYCIYYNRFGKCRKGKSCPFIHDPNNVAICTRFLRGKCNAVKCLFSHKVEQHKMPTCSHFLRAACTRENCPYVHVKVNREADVCSDFLKGCCPKEKECKRKHVLLCEQYESLGSCKKGRKCQLYHRLGKRTTRRLSSSDTRIPEALRRSNFQSYASKVKGEGSGALQIQPKALLGLTQV